MHVILWRFTARDPEAFERHYGPNGTWAQLFRRDPHYVRTDLLKSADAYITLDWWTSPDAYASFHREHADAYAELDRTCEQLTASEEKIGEFSMVGVAV